MSWKIVRNDQPSKKELSYSGECPRFHEKAIVTGMYCRRYTAKTDRIPTYSLKEYRCTLLENIGGNGLCPMEKQCPLMPEKYL